VLLHIWSVRMQRGHFYRAIGAWHLRYRVNGKQVSVKLAEYNDEYRTLNGVRPLGEPYLQPANLCNSTPRRCTFRLRSASDRPYRDLYDHVEKFARLSPDEQRYSFKDQNKTSSTSGIPVALLNFATRHLSLYILHTKVSKLQVKSEVG
jgi:hypothetical protein